MHRHWAFSEMLAMPAEQTPVGSHQSTGLKTSALLALCTDDTLLYIVSYITNPKDLLQLALTCRRFVTKCVAAAPTVGQVGADVWSIVDEVARRWLVKKSQGCGWTLHLTPRHGAESWLGVMHQAQEMGPCCSVCKGPLGMQCYRIHCDRGLGCADGICAACFIWHRYYLCVGDDAPRGFGAAYSHRMVGCVSHTQAIELDDDDGTALPSVFHFCRCHEGCSGPELRRELADLRWSDLCQRLRESGALKPVLVPLAPGQWETMTDSQKTKYKQVEQRDEESRELLVELTASETQREHVLSVLVACAAE